MREMTRVITKTFGSPRWLGPLQLYITAPLHYAVVLRSEIAVMGNGSEARKTHSCRPQIKVILFLDRQHCSCVI